MVKDAQRHLQKLPAHLARMALVDLQNGVRDDVVCNLRWEWEVPLEQLGFQRLRRAEAIRQWPEA
jgi:hypothetical protein